jgi:hypothetical protein
MQILYRLRRTSFHTSIKLFFWGLNRKVLEGNEKKKKKKKPQTTTSKSAH